MIKKQVIFFLTIAIWFGCSTSKSSLNKVPANNSHYHIQKYEINQKADSAIIVSEAQNLQHHIIKCFNIKVDNKEIFKADCDGSIAFKLAPGSHTFNGYMVGYDSVNTNKFFINAGDSIRINFYLEQDISLHED